MTDAEFASFLADAYAELQRKQDALHAEYFIGTYSRWWFEQETAKLQFLEQNVVAVEADFISIGSYSPSAKTWKWAWANQSVLPTLRRKAEKLRELEDITDRALFGCADPFEADET